MAGEPTNKVYVEQGGDTLVIRGKDGGVMKGQTAAAATPAQAGAITDLTHAVGTADGTVDDVGASFNQTTLNNNFKEVTAKLASILAALRGVGIVAS